LFLFSSTTLAIPIEEYVFWGNFTMKRILLAIAACLLAITANAQQPQTHRCMTDEVDQQLMQLHPELQSQRQAFLDEVKTWQNSISNNGSGKTNQLPAKIIIPVVFHVIHTNGNENIPRSQMLAQLDVLNRDYQKLNADTNLIRPRFRKRVANMRIEFRMATKDPNGNCTNGVVRLYSQLSKNADNQVKSLSIWDPRRYLNIWVVQNINSTSLDNGIILGYAQFPYPGTGLVSTDGIVVRANAVGGQANTGPQYLGRTLTHEIGHWLGLAHPFQGNCTGGDGVADTPPVANPSFGGCPSTGKNSCHNDLNPDLEQEYGTIDSITADEPDMWEDYMDYADDECMHMFTVRQKEVMDTVLVRYRSLIWSAANLIQTGTDDSIISRNGGVCAPVADFFTNDRFLCEGTATNFFDNSFNGVPTSWQWTFNGGTPSTSTDQNPQGISFSPGIHQITLTASNAVGSSTRTIDTLIRVLPTTGQQIATYSEDFTNPLFWYTGWDAYSIGTLNKWTRTALASFSGPACMYVRNSRTNQGNTYNLVSPSFNLTNVTGSGYTPYLNYRWSYAGYKERGHNSQNLTDSLVRDRFNVYYSVNCGRSWNSLKNYTVSSQANDQNSLNTINGFLTQTFIDYYPADANKWRTASLNLGTLGNTDNARFRFEFYSDGGKNMFLDDINVGYSLSVNQPDNKLSTFTIYPNPTRGASTLDYTLSESANVQISIIDLTGRNLATIANGTQTAGNHKQNLDLPGQALAPGIYFVRLVANGVSQTIQLIVQ